MSMEDAVMSGQLVDTQQIDEAIDLPEYVRKSGPKIDVNDIDALLSHPSPIIISYRQLVPPKKTIHHFRGLLFGIEPNGNLIWLVAHPGGPLGIHFEAYSSQKEAFIENDEISSSMRCARYVDTAVGAAEARWAACQGGDQTHNGWLGEQRKVITDCVLWGLREADARFLGLRGPRPWAHEVLKQDSPVSVEFHVQEKRESPYGESQYGEVQYEEPQEGQSQEGEELLVVELGQEELEEGQGKRRQSFSRRILLRLSLAQK